jgi:hypothetical protein
MICSKQMVAQSVQKQASVKLCADFQTPDVQEVIGSIESGNGTARGRVKLKK